MDLHTVCSFPRYTFWFKAYGNINLIIKKIRNEFKMSIVVLFDPSIKSLNIGDQIIMKSASRELAPLCEKSFVIRCGTHTPVVTSYQNRLHNWRTELFNKTDFKFVCGSNLLWKRMLKPEPSWNINIFNYSPYTCSILLVVGTNK